MKHLSGSSWLLLALALFCGCGGGTKISGPHSDPPADPVGNWQFSTKSAAEFPPMTIAGSIAQSGASLSGGVHVGGSHCFDPLTTVSLTGSVDRTGISMTSAQIAGQVITFRGSITENPLTRAADFTGTYSIQGGCADGDQGNVTGNNIPFIANVLNGTFTSSKGDIFDVAADVAQNSHPSSAGNFGITGTVTFTKPCFSSGTITSGTFPAGSYVIGTSVTLEIETDNGNLAFHGTVDPDKVEISGDYTVSGSTCDQAGTGVLLGSSPWDY
jgi:hypothetical protein